MSNGKERPTMVLVLGIINIVFGVLGICGGLLSLTGSLSPGESDPIVFPEEVKTWMSLLQGVSLALSVALIVGGIGLIQVKNWGRLLTIIYALVDIPVSLASTIITTRAIKPLMEQQGAGDIPPEALNIIFGTTIGVGVCCGLIYPIVLLVVLNLRSVKAAFTGGGASQQPPIAPQA